MRKLQEDLDDLDRMVDTGAAKAAIRSQIRLIAREVAALEVDYARLAKDHAQTQDAATKAIAERDAQLAEMKATDRKALDDWFRQKAKQQADYRKRYTLNYDA